MDQPSRFLSLDRINILTVAAAFLMVALIVPFRISPEGFILDRTNYVLGRDFLNFWQYGQAFWGTEKAAFFDSSIYNAHLDKLMGHDYIDQKWSYLPHTMLVAAPFGLLNYNVALAFFTAFGGCFFMKQNIALLNTSIAKIAIITAPALFMCVLCGQFSLFVAAAFAFIVLKGDDFPILTACIIAVLTIKPQLGLVLPVYLLATGRFRLFFYTATATLTLLGTSVLVLGTDVWMSYFEHASGQVRLLTLSHDLVLGMMPTLPVQLSLAGLNIGVAMLAQAIVTIAALISSLRLFQKSTTNLQCLVILVGATYIATPYLMVYDILMLCWVALLVMQIFKVGKIYLSLYALLMILPILGPVLSRTLGLGSAFILYAFILSMLHVFIKGGWKSSKDIIVAQVTPRA